MIKKYFVTLGLIVAMIAGQFSVFAEVEAPVAQDEAIVEVTDKENTDSEEATSELEEADKQEDVEVSAEDLEVGEEEVELSVDDLEDGEDVISPDKQETDKRKPDSSKNDVKVFAEAKDLGNIFESGYVKVNDVPVTDNTIIDLDQAKKVGLHYKWSTKDLIVNNGDYAEIKVPDVFKGRNFTGRDILAGGLKVGTYSLQDNIIRFVFNEKMGQHAEVRKGEVGFTMDFNKEKFEENIIQEIDFNDGADKTLTVIGKPESDVSSIEKEGQPNSDKDATEIDWTVNVANPSVDPIEGASITDVIPEGLALEDLEKVTLEKVKVNLDGSLKGIEEFKDVTPTLEGDKLTVPVGDLDPFEGYQLKYTTKITDYTKESFTNKANLEYGDTEIPAKATVSGIERSDAIEKDGSANSDKKSIDWVIDVNKAGLEIENAIVNDELPKGLTIDADSLKVYNLTQDESNNWVESNEDHSFTEFPIKLGQLEKGQARRIRFTTDIDFTKVNDGDYQKINEFLNKTDLKDGEEPRGDAEKNVRVTRDSILEKTGNQKVDYDNKTIDWKLVVNKANHDIKDARITDQLPDGLELDLSTIVVKNSDGQVVETGKYTNDSDENGLDINLGSISSEYMIEFTTDITDFTQNEFKNSAKIEGDGIIGDGENDAAIPVKPTGNSFNKDYSGINYDKREMDWTLRVNPKRDALETLTITDTFPNKGLILIENTLEITLGGVKVEENNYELKPRTEDGVEGYQKGFTIEFKGDVLPINNDLVITYTTSFDPEEGADVNTSNDGVYKNNAIFEGKTINGHDYKTEDGAQKKVKTTSWESGKKTGSLIKNDGTAGWENGDDRKIRWEVYANYHKQNLGGDAVFTDRLGYEGKIDKQSIELRTFTVSKDGKVTLGDELDLDYELVLSDDSKQFTLNFNENVSERFAVVFTTSVPNISAGIYTNTANTKGNGLDHTYEGTVRYDDADKNISKSLLTDTDTAYTDEELDWEIKINESLSVIEENVKIVDTISSGLVYIENSLEVSVLKNGKWEVVDYYDLNVEVNDSDQTLLDVQFHNAVTSTYKFNYKTVVVAETGEVNNSVSYTGSNLEEKTITTDRMTVTKDSYVSGDYNELKGLIRVNKNDDDGELIQSSEATFKLYYMLNGEKRYVVNPNVDTEEGTTLFTTDNGQLTIANLNLKRTYYLEEVEAPEGYVKSTETFEINVEEPSRDMTYDQDVENKLIHGDIGFTKTNDREEPLAEAVFKLYTKDNDTYVATSTSNKDGYVLFENVEYGDYVIKETTTPEGHLPANDIEVSIEEDGVTVELDDVVNDIIRGNISLKKTDDFGNSLEGAVFELFAAADTNFEKSLGRVTSNGEGEVTFKDVEYGDYIIRETEAPTGYVAHENIEVSLVENGHTVAIEGDVKNEVIRGNIEFVKTNDRGEPLAEAVFELFAQDGETSIATSTSDAQGYVSFENIEYGDYVIKETSIPEGHLIADDIEVTITENGKTVTLDPVVNDIIRGDIELLKTDRYGTPLENAAFTLYDLEGHVVIEDMMSNQDGLVVFEDVAYGEYVIKETKAPEGYEMSTLEHHVEITEDVLTVTTNMDEDSLVVENTELGRIEIHKVDKKDETQYLEGAVFEVRDADQQVVGTITTDKEGIAKLGDLDYGIYTVVEIKAPKGYALDQTVHTVDLNGDDEGVHIEALLTLENRKQTHYIPMDPGHTSVDVEKVWEGKALDEVIVHLLADGEKISTVILSDANDWTHTFVDLPVVHDIQDENTIVYTVEEESVQGYTTKVTGDMENGFTITNTEIEDPIPPKDDDLPSTGMGNALVYSSGLMVIIGVILRFFDKKRADQ